LFCIGKRTRTKADDFATVWQPLMNEVYALKAFLPRFGKSTKFGKWFYAP